MPITVGTSNLEPNLINGNIGVRVAQIAKDQQKVEGEIALQLVTATNEAPQSRPIGNSGHNINTSA
ncbi:cytoplasmic protein [Shewanella sp. VB17]|uniref:cytoplasmic protein n=1 Tax=Shewanella sp. VB17 TaxID=2739432 RepID=UPI00156429AB|nr:cytoplasmic protein [Shewanella sp. VB17]NRD75410.1 cytoplasmic protein [Shewanella sp. VB17]